MHTENSHDAALRIPVQLLLYGTRNPVRVSFLIKCKIPVHHFPSAAVLVPGTRYTEQQQRDDELCCTATNTTSPLGVANFLRNGQRRISYQFVAVIAIVRLNGVIIALNAPHLRSIKCFYSSQSESGHH